MTSTEQKLLICGLAMLLVPFIAIGIAMLIGWVRER